MKKETKKLYDHLTSHEVVTVAKIQSFILSIIHQFFREKGFVELPPIIISPLTDPLAHGVHPTTIDYEGQKLQLTKSMIFHKQLSLMSKELEKIYIISPNVRLEKSGEAKERHLLEFQQVDFEIKNAKKSDIYQLMEELLGTIVKKCLSQFGDELSKMGSKIKPLPTKFPIFKTYEVEKEYGPDFETVLSEKMDSPFWLESFYREFYDKEDPKTKGHFINYDLIYPFGFGEGLSGAEREDEYDVIMKKMKERKMDFSAYDIYLDLAKEGLIPRTAGAGFGMQRLLRYITGIKSMEKTALFPRSPREKITF